MILDLAKRTVVTVAPGDGIPYIVGLMAYYNVGSVIVTVKGRPTGVITDRDILMRTALRKGKAPAPDELTARDVMTSPARVVREDDRFDAVLRLMRTSGIRRLPVVDRRGRLRAIVSLDDIVETLGRNLAVVADALQTQGRTPKRAAGAKPPGAAAM